MLSGDNIEKNSILFERKRQTYGNGERYFFYVSYGILTEKRNSYVFLKRNTEIRIPMNGITET